MATNDSAQTTAQTNEQQQGTQDGEEQTSPTQQLATNEKTHSIQGVHKHEPEKDKTACNNGMKK